MAKRSLMTLILASTCAVSVSAAPQTPVDTTSITELANLSGNAPAVDAKTGFVWSPDVGFSSIRLPGEALGNGAGTDGSEKLLGFTGSDAPGVILKWHPELGLVPVDGATAEPVAWTSGGNALRTVVWSAEDLAALVALMSLPEGVSVIEVNDVSKSGEVLGRAIVGENGETSYFVWKAGAPLQFLEPGAGNSFVSVAALSDGGHAIGQVAGPDGTETAAVSQPDGSVRVLPGPNGAASQASGVNSNGEVVGTSTTVPPAALYWGPDGQPVDLAERLTSPLPDGFALLGSNDINDAGQIAAHAMSPTGSIHVVTLTPDGNGGYTPRVIGEIYASAAFLPVGALSLSDSGQIAGECSFGARDCPSRPIDFSGLDPNITNLFNPNGVGAPGVLPLRSGSLPSTGTGAGAGGGTPAAFSSSSSGNQNRPDFGTPNFPTLGSGTTTDDDGVAAAATPSVPLPAAGWALLMGLILLLRPGAALRALRESVRRTA